MSWNAHSNVFGWIYVRMCARYIHTIIPSEFTQFPFAKLRDRDEHLPFACCRFSTVRYLNPKTICAPPTTYHLLIKFNVFCIKPDTPFIYLWQKACGDVVRHWSTHLASESTLVHRTLYGCRHTTSRYVIHLRLYILCSKSILHVYNLKWESAFASTSVVLYDCQR